MAWFLFNYNIGLKCVEGVKHYVNVYIILPISAQCYYYIETTPLICTVNQWTGFYIVTNLGWNRLIFDKTRFALDPKWFLIVVNLKG